MAILGAFLLLVGAAIWTAIIKKAESINILVVTTPLRPDPTSLGIQMSAGPGLTLLWVAVALMVASVGPYMARSVPFLT